MRPAQDLTTRHSARRGSLAALVPLGLALLLSACVSEPPPGPAFVVLPGRNKDVAAFQQDDATCRHHAAAKTGYSAASGPASGSASGAGAVPAPGTVQAGPGNSSGQAEAAVLEPADQAAYAQCMAARGDVVQAQPSGYPAGPAPYGYPYAYEPYAAWPGYPYGYDYPFFLYGGGFYGGFGWARDGYYHGTWHRGGLSRGGFAARGLGRSGHGRGGGGHR